MEAPMPDFDLDLTTASRDGAERVFLVMTSTVTPNASNTNTFTRNGKEKISVRAACMPSNSVQNGVRYSGDVISESLWSFSNIPIPRDHPSDDQGRFLSAQYDPDGRVFGFLGGSFENVTIIENKNGDGSRIWGDAVFDRETLNSTEGGRETLSRIEKGKPISMSTGLYVDVVSTPTADGYDFDCVWMRADHLALLPPGVKPASTTKQGTGMFVAQRKEPVKMKMLACNLDATDIPPAKADDPAPDPALAGNSEGDSQGVLTSLAKALIPFMNRGSAALDEEDTMSDSVTKDELAATNTAVEGVQNKVSDLEGKLPEMITNAVKEAVQPILEANEAVAKANAEAAAKAKAEKVDKVVALNALPKEAAEAAPVETLDALIANAEATKGSATAANRSGDGGAATNAYSDSDLDAEEAVGSDSKEG